MQNYERQPFKLTEDTHTHIYTQTQHKCIASDSKRDESRGQMSFTLWKILVLDWDII